MSDMRKRVRFPEGDVYEVVGMLPTRDEMELEDLTTLFFSKHEFQLAQSAAKVISREADRYGFAKSLADTFVEKNKEAQEKLNVWAAHGHTRRGLERWANRDHGLARQSDQFQVIMEVLRAQDEYYTDKSKDTAKKVDHLRKVSHKATRTSRHFARMMGKADAYALTQDLQDDEQSAITEMSGMTLHSDYRKSSVTDANATTMDDTDVNGEDIDLTPQADELDDSKHVSKLGKHLKRFGFGRKRKDGVGVSRVA